MRTETEWAEYLDSRKGDVAELRATTTDAEYREAAGRLGFAVTVDDVVATVPVQHRVAVRRALHAAGA